MAVKVVGDSLDLPVTAPEDLIVGRNRLAEGLDLMPNGEVQVSPRDRLLNLESEIDRSVAAVRLRGLSRAQLLEFLHGAIYMLMHGSPFHGTEPRPGDGEALIGRLSYLSKIILNSPDQVDESEDEWADLVELDSMLRQIVLYGHACELFPEVRSGWLEVGQMGSKFLLEHADDRTRTFEERDVILTELAAPVVARLPLDGPHLSGPLLSAPGKVTAKGLLLLPALYRALYSTDDELLNDGALGVIAGLTVAEFRRFSLAMAAIGLWHIALAEEAGSRFLRCTRTRTRLKWLNEQREWSAPTLSASYFYGQVRDLAGLRDDQIDPLLQMFTLGSKVSVAGDGFYPPLHIVAGDGRELVLFSPDALIGMINQRNLLYVLSRTRKRDFDEKVSPQLEATLIDQAAAQFGVIEGLEVRRDANWTHDGVSGEFDLIIWDSIDNFVFHIQAKAPIPAQGARMVKRLEGRILEAIDQLSRFDSLPEHGRANVLRQLFGENAILARVGGGVLTRHGFGTIRTWIEMGDYVPFNLTLLTECVGRELLENEPRLMSIVGRLVTVLNDTVAAVEPRWESAEVEFGDPSNPVRTVLPLMQYDKTKLDTMRASMVSAGRARGGLDSISGVIQPSPAPVWMTGGLNDVEPASELNGTGD